jgi:hypothetical protein
MDGPVSKEDPNRGEAEELEVNGLREDTKDEPGGATEGMDNVEDEIDDGSIGGKDAEVPLNDVNEAVVPPGIVSEGMTDDWSAGLMVWIERDAGIDDRVVIGDGVPGGEVTDVSNGVENDPTNGITLVTAVVTVLVWPLLVSVHVVEKLIVFEGFKAIEVVMEPARTLVVPGSGCSVLSCVCVAASDVDC